MLGRSGGRVRACSKMTHQKLQVSPCPRRASGHAWRLARQRSTRECEADECQACRLVRMTAYRTGQVVGYGRSGDGVRTERRPQGREDEPSSSDQVDSGVNELPSVALTTKFLELCQQYGSEQLAAGIVAVGRSTGVLGLPRGNHGMERRRDASSSRVPAAQIGSGDPREPQKTPSLLAEPFTRMRSHRVTNGWQDQRRLAVRLAVKRRRLRVWRSSSRRDLEERR